MTGGHHLADLSLPVKNTIKQQPISALTAVPQRVIYIQSKQFFCHIPWIGLTDINGQKMKSPCLMGYMTFRFSPKPG